jgi:hypothetical protein
MWHPYDPVNLPTPCSAVRLMADVQKASTHQPPPPCKYGSPSRMTPSREPKAIRQALLRSPGKPMVWCHHSCPAQVQSQSFSIPASTSAILRSSGLPQKCDSAITQSVSLRSPMLACSCWKQEHTGGLFTMPRTIFCLLLSALLHVCLCT